MVSVHQHEKVLVANFPAAFIRLVEPLACEEHSQAASRRVAPLILTHLIATGIQPQHIFHVRALDGAPLKKSPAPEYRMPLAKIDHPLNEGQQVAILRLQTPIQPAYLVVLAVGIVVTHLCMTHGVSGIHHWYALRKQERRQKISFMLWPPR